MLQKFIQIGVVHHRKKEFVSPSFKHQKVRHSSTVFHQFLLQPVETQTSRIHPTISEMSCSLEDSVCFHWLPRDDQQLRQPAWMRKLPFRHVTFHETHLPPRYSGFLWKSHHKCCCSNKYCFFIFMLTRSKFWFQVHLFFSNNDLLSFSSFPV